MQQLDWLQVTKKKKQKKNKYVFALYLKGLCIYYTNSISTREGVSLYFSQFDCVSVNLLFCILVAEGI